jgi:hypothetical protein
MIQQLDRWYCYEVMLQANMPGQRDGRIAVWLDGMLVADFPGLRLRDVATLKIDRFGLSFHIGSNPNGQARKWYDNVVAAKSYIGPLSRRDATVRVSTKKRCRRSHNPDSARRGDSGPGAVYTAGAKMLGLRGELGTGRGGREGIESCCRWDRAGRRRLLWRSRTAPAAFTKLVVVKVLRRACQRRGLPQMFLSEARLAARLHTRTSCRPTRSSRSTARRCW